MLGGEEGKKVVGETGGREERRERGTRKGRKELGGRGRARTHDLVLLA